MLESIAKEYDFDFKLQKSNKRYVELGSNNKLATFKMWYRPVVIDAESFIKVQITFLEIIKYPITEKVVLSLVDADAFSQTDRIYFSDYMDLYKPLKLRVYDLREIACEKIRALLTRKGIKARDIVDLYFIGKIHRINVDALKDACIEKITFAIKSYEKYKKNILTRMDLSEKNLVLDNVEHFMIAEIDKKDFDAFIKKLFAFLEKVKTAALLNKRTYSK